MRSGISLGVRWKWKWSNGIWKSKIRIFSCRLGKLEKLKRPFLKFVKYYPGFPSVLHGWKATDLRLLMVKRKLYSFILTFGGCPQTDLCTLADRVCQKSNGSLFLMILVEQTEKVKSVSVDCGGTSWLWGDIFFLGAPQLRTGLGFLFFFKVSFMKHPNVHPLEKFPSKLEISLSPRDSPRALIRRACATHYIPPLSSV